MKKAGFLDQAAAYLKEAGMESIIIDGVEPNPSVETVLKGAAAMTDFGPDWIVAVGGVITSYSIHYTKLYDAIDGDRLG